MKTARELIELMMDGGDPQAFMDPHTTKPTEKDIRQYLTDHPNPSDSDFHSWCDSMGFEKDEAEEIMYALATQHVQHGH